MKKLLFALLASTAIVAPRDAEAAPVVVFAATQLGAAGVATWAATTAGAFLINTAASVALSYASTALQKAQTQTPRSQGIRTEVSTRGETTAQTIIFGRYATAGNHVAPPMVHGISGTKGKGRNRYLTYVLDLADLPIDDWEAVVVNSEHTVVFDGGAEGGAQAYLGTKAGGDLDGNMWLSGFHDGRQTDADPFLMSVYGDPGDPYPERPWSDDMVLTGVPYIVLNFRRNAKLFPGFPNVRVQVRGMRLYDPRKDSTAGGSGSHRLNNDATWEFTENPVVMVYNLMLGLDMLDGTFYGVGVDQNALPVSVWAAAMNVCDEDVTLSGGGTEKRYRAGLEFSTDTEPFAVIEHLMTACGGKVAEMGGAWYITVGPPATASLSITDDDILISSPDEFDPFPSQDEIFNGVHATFPDPNQEWSTREAVPLYNATWEAEDGQRNVAELNLSAVPYPRQVRRLMRENVADGRRMRTHSITLPPEASGTPVLSTIIWDSDHNYYSNKLFEVVGKQIDPNTLFTTLTIRERDPNDYDGDAAADGFIPPVISPAAPAIIYDGLDGWQVSGTTIPGTAGGTTLPAIRLQWAVDTAESGNVEWHVREKSTGQLVATSQDTYLAGTQGIYVAAGIVSDTTYEARARHLDSRTDNLWSQWEEATTPGTSDFEEQIRSLFEEQGLYAIRDVNTVNGSLVPLRPGEIVFARDTGKLYEHNGSGWVLVFAGVDVADIEGQVTAAQIAAGAVTQTKIADNSISTPKLVAGSVTTGKIASGAVTTGELAALAVTAGKIAANTITGNKIAADTITGGLMAASGIITNSAQINNGLITNAKIANAAITNAKIDDLAVNRLKVQDNSVVVGRSWASGGVDVTNAPINSWTTVYSRSFTTVNVGSHAVIADARFDFGGIEPDASALDVLFEIYSGSTVYSRVVQSFSDVENRDFIGGFSQFAMVPGNVSIGLRLRVMGTQYVDTDVDFDNIEIIAQEFTGK